MSFLSPEILAAGFRSMSGLASHRFHKHKHRIYTEDGEDDNNIKMNFKEHY